MTDLILYLVWLVVLVFTNIFWCLQCKKKDDEWLALLKRHTEDWQEHCKYINNNWSELIEEILNGSEKMDKTCINCACDKVCNHDVYGFENCGNFIPAGKALKERKDK